MEENPCGTRVFKTWVSLLRLKFERLEFHFFFLMLFWVLTQCSSLCRSEDHPTFNQIVHVLRQIVEDHPDWIWRPPSVQSNHSYSSSDRWRPPSVQSDRSCSSSDRSSLFTQCSSLFLVRSFLCSSSSDGSSCSSGLSFFKYQNRVLETRFCFFELESIRLKIYLASYFQLTKWKSSL